MKHSGYFSSLPVCLVALAALAAILPTAGCQPRYGNLTVGGEHSAVSISFTDRDRRVIQDYFRHRVPPGLAKKGGLPPGLARKQVLPSGARTHRLPADLVTRLSPIPPGYVRVRVGTDIVLMEGSTRLVLDIVHDVYHPRH
jgi:hypothetical protein